MLAVAHSGSAAIRAADRRIARQRRARRRRWATASVGTIRPTIGARRSFQPASVESSPGEPQHDEIRPGPVGQAVAATTRPPIEWPYRTTGRPAGAARTAARRSCEVVVQRLQRIHVATPPAGPAVAPVVVGVGVDAGRGQLVADVLVAAGVLAEAVDEQRRVAHGSASLRPMAGQCRVNRSMPSAVVTCPMMDVMDMQRTRLGALATIGHAARPMRWPAAGSSSADRVFVRRYRLLRPEHRRSSWATARRSSSTPARRTRRRARSSAHVRELTAFPVTVVVDTHGHFDHAFGNAVFRPATIWGQAGCVPFMAGPARRARRPSRADEPDLADDLAEVAIDPPDRTFDVEATLEVGGRPVGLRYLGRGHTDHDVVISVPGTGVVFGGDLVEHGNVPFYGDGYAFDWPATAPPLAALVAPRDGVLVPGHGDHAGRDFADAQARSIAALADLARRVEAGELTLDEAIAAHPFPALPADDARGAFDRALRQLGGASD